MAWVPAPGHTWWLAPISDSSSNRSKVLSWPPYVLHPHGPWTYIEAKYPSQRLRVNLRQMYTVRALSQKPVTKSWKDDDPSHFNGGGRREGGPAKGSHAKLLQ